MLNNSTKNIFSSGAKVFALTFAVTSSTVFIVWAASAASTVIGTNISTGGTLTVGGLASLVNATGTQLTITSNVYLASSGGVVGIGTTSPSQTFSVQGNILVSGTSTVGGIFATGTIQAIDLTLSNNASTSGKLTVSSGSATSTFSWGVSMNRLQLTSTTATSTAGMGFDISNGCFSIRGVCVGGNTSAGSFGSFDTITLPLTNATAGIIYSTTNTLLHTFGGNTNFFAGVNAGRRGRRNKSSKQR